MVVVVVVVVNVDVPSFASVVMLTNFSFFLNYAVVNDAAQKSGGSAAASSSECRVPLAKIDEGAHKYVLVRASKTVGGEEQMFVRSASGAPYHADVARPLLDKLMEEKYENVKVLGGGRISLSHSDRKITIYGHR